MSDIEYKFRPCDCCTPPQFSPPTFLGKYYLYECSNKCGAQQTDIGQAGAYPRPIGDPPLYIATTYYNVDGDLCKYYKVFNRIRDYTVIPDFPEIICDDVFTYYIDNNGNCQVEFSVGPTDLNCEGFPGNSRDDYFTYTDLITDCNYVLFDPDNLGYSSETGDVEALEYINRIGNVKEKSTTTLEKIRHAPSPTCYLKVWARTRIQKYKMPPRDPAFTEGFQEGVLRGPCDGPFIVDGPIENVGGQQFTYEWEGSGRPCLNNETKRYFEEENVIEGDINWTFDVFTEGPATGVSVIFETKYSFVRGYEPKWPSERDGNNDCKRDGFPRC